MNKVLHAVSILPFLLSTLLLAGQNLVPNGSFEQFTALPNDDCDWALAQGWNNAATSAECNSSNGTPDYYHLLGEGLFSELPQNYWATVLPFEGDAVMGVAGYFGFSANAREYIATQLSTPLEPGFSYQLRFSITHGMPMQDGYAVDGWGAVLSVNPLLQPAGTNGVISAPDGAFMVPAVVDQDDWQTFSFEFLADSAYNFITIGNFKPDNQLSIQNKGEPGFFAFAYSFVDELSLEPLINPLPIELLYFSARPGAGGSVALEWATATETNNAFFTIERSRDARAWELLHTEPGAGNRNTRLDYHYTDYAPLTPGTYYRLKQTDFDGQYSYSEIDYVDLTAAASSMRAFPNPAEGRITIQGGGPNAFDYKIFDLLGRDCTNASKLLEAGEMDCLLDVSQLPAGHYWIGINGSGTRFIKL